VDGANVPGYEDGLGSPWFTLSDYPIYLQWRLFEWWNACGPCTRRLVLLDVENVRDDPDKQRVGDILLAF
jgi:hypothetical protein